VTFFIININEEMLKVMVVMYGHLCPGSWLSNCWRAKETVPIHENLCDYRCPLGFAKNLQTFFFISWEFKRQ
jgi:hypothetical protein